MGAQQPSLKLGIDCREFAGEHVTGVRRHLDQFVRHVLPDLPGKTILMAPPSGLAALPRLPNNTSKVRLSPAPTWVIDQVILPRLARRTGVTTLLSPYYKIPMWGPFRKVITVHDVMFIRHDSYPLVSRMASRLQLAVSSRIADRILVGSYFTRDDLTSSYPHALGKVDVVYPCLAGKRDSSPSNSRTDSLPPDLMPPGPFFLYVGNFKQHKNVEILIQGFSRFLSDTGNKMHHLVLAGGDARNTSRIERLATSAAPGRIRVTQGLSDAGRRMLYQRASWFVTASEYEGLCYPIIEAMTYSCPVLHLPVTAIPEIVGGCGISMASATVDGVAKGLAQVVAIPETHRQAIIEKGRTRAVNFEPETTRAAFVKMLSRIGAL